MQRLRSFILLTLLGGVGVILPLLLFVVLARWALGVARDLTLPLAATLGSQIEVASPWSHLIVFFGLLILCFFTGLIVRTPLGGWLHERADEWLSRIAPGYRMVRDTVGQLLGSGSGGLRGEVALIRLYGVDSGVRQLAIVTARHADGFYTVYVPTAPLPTQGFVYHLPAECVELHPGMSVEAAMRMVFACGSGAADLLGARLTATSARSA